MTMYGNFRKCGTRFYPVRTGAVRYKVLVLGYPKVKLVPLLSTPCGTTGKDYCYDGCHWITY